MLDSNNLIKNRNLNDLDTRKRSSSLSVESFSSENPIVKKMSRQATWNEGLSSNGSNSPSSVNSSYLNDSSEKREILHSNVQDSRRNILLKELNSQHQELGEKKNFLQRLVKNDSLVENSPIRLVTTKKQEYFELPPSSFYKLNLPSFDSYHHNVSYMVVYCNGLVMNRYIISLKNSTISTPIGKNDRVNIQSGKSTPASAISPDRTKDVSEFILSFFEESLDPFSNFNLKSISDSETVGEIKNEKSKIEIWFRNEKLENIAYVAFEKENFSTSYEDIKTYPISFFDNLHNKQIDSKELYLSIEKMNPNEVRDYLTFALKHYFLSKTKAYTSPTPYYLPFIMTPCGSTFHFKFNFSSIVKHWSIFFGTSVQIMLYSRKTKHIIGEIVNIGKIMDYTQQAPQKIPTNGVEFEALNSLESIRLMFAGSIDTIGISELERGLYFDDTLSLLLVFVQNNSVQTIPSTPSSKPGSPRIESDKNFDNLITRQRTLSNPAVANSFISPRRNVPTPTSTAIEKPNAKRFNSIRDLNEFVSKTNNRSPGATQGLNTANEQNATNISNNSIGSPIAFSLLSLYNRSDDKNFIKNGIYSLHLYKGSPCVGPWKKSNQGEKQEDISQFLIPQNLLCDVTVKSVFQHDEIIQDGKIRKCICETENKESIDEVLVNIVQSNGKILESISSDFEIWRHLSELLDSLQALIELSTEYTRTSNYDSEGRVLLSLCIHFHILMERILKSNSNDLKLRVKDEVSRRIFSDFLEKYIKIIYIRTKQIVSKSHDSHDSSLIMLSYFEILSHVISILSLKSNHAQYFEVTKAILNDINAIFPQYSNNHTNLPIIEMLAVVKGLLPACYTLQSYDSYIGNSLGDFLGNIKDITNFGEDVKYKVLEFINFLYGSSQNTLTIINNSPHDANILRLQKSFLGTCAQLITSYATQISNSKYFISSLYEVLQTIFDNFLKRKITTSVENALKETKALIMLELQIKLFPLFSVLMDLLEENLLTSKVLNKNSEFLMDAIQWFMLRMLMNSSTLNTIMKQYMPTIEEIEGYFNQFFSIFSSSLDRYSNQTQTLIEGFLLKQIENFEIIAHLILPTILFLLPRTSLVWKSFVQSLLTCIHIYYSKSLCNITSKLNDSLIDDFDEDYLTETLSDPTNSPNSETAHEYISNTIGDKLWLLTKRIVWNDVGISSIFYHRSVLDQFFSLLWYVKPKNELEETRICKIIWLLSYYSSSFQSYPQYLLESVLKTSGEKKFNKESDLEGFVTLMTNFVNINWSMIDHLNPEDRTWLNSIKKTDSESIESILKTFSNDCVELIYSSYFISTFNQIRSQCILIRDEKFSYFEKYPPNLKSEALKVDLHYSAASICILSIFLRMNKVREGISTLANLMQFLFNIEGWKELTNCTILYVYLLSKISQNNLINAEVNNQTADPYIMIGTFSDMISTGEGFLEFMETILRNDSSKLTPIKEMLIAASYFSILGGNNQFSIDILNRLREYFENAKKLEDQLSNLLEIHEKMIEYYKLMQTSAKHLGNLERYAIISIRHVEKENYFHPLSLWKSGDYIIQMRHNEDFIQLISNLKHHFPHFKFLMPQNVLPLNPVSPMIKLSLAFDESKINLLSTIKSHFYQIKDMNVRNIITFDTNHDEEPYSGGKELSYSKMCISTNHHFLHSLPSISRFSPIDILRTEVQNIDQKNLLHLWLTSILQGIEKSIPKEIEENQDINIVNILIEQTLSILLDSSQPFMETYVYGFQQLINLDKQYETYREEKLKKAKDEARRQNIQEIKIWNEKVKEDPNLPKPILSTEIQVDHDEIVLQLRILRDEVVEKLSRVYLWLTNRTTKQESLNTSSEDAIIPNERIVRLETAMSSILWG